MVEVVHPPTVYKSSAEEWTSVSDDGLPGRQLPKVYTGTRGPPSEGPPVWGRMGSEWGD